MKHDAHGRSDRSALYAGCSAARPRAWRLGLASALLLLPTLITSPAAAFRTGAETGNFDDTQKVRWASDSVEFQITEGGPQDLEQAEIERVVEQGLATWSEASCTGFRFVNGGSVTSGARPEDGKNSVSWVESGWTDRGWAEDAAAITDLLYEKDSSGEWRITEGDIYVNADNHSWVLEGPSDGSRDLLSVATHEAGHLLGLLHPCEPDGADGAPDCASRETFQDATMYPFYDPGQASLSEDDVAGTCFLYPKSPCSEQGCGPGMVCREQGCVAECGKDTCAPGERCSVEGCKALGDCVTGKCKSCKADADCAKLGQVCGLGSYCVAEARDGDPCRADTDCAGGLCSVDGYCTSLCRQDDECPEGLSCALGPVLGQCVGRVKGLGESCTSPEDCIGGFCLEGAAETAICSRACGKQNAYCPGDWDCVAVGDQAVCSPLAPERAETCSLTSKPRTPSVLITLNAALLVAIQYWRRRRRLS